MACSWASKGPITPRAVNSASSRCDFARVGAAIVPLDVRLAILEYFTLPVKSFPTLNPCDVVSVRVPLFANDEPDNPSTKERLNGRPGLCLSTVMPFDRVWDPLMAL